MRSWTPSAVTTRSVWIFTSSPPARAGNFSIVLELPGACCRGRRPHPQGTLELLDGAGEDADSVFQAARLLWVRRSSLAPPHATSPEQARRRSKSPRSSLALLETWATKTLAVMHREAADRHTASRPPEMAACAPAGLSEPLEALDVATVAGDLPFAGIDPAFASSSIEADSAYMSRPPWCRALPRPSRLLPRGLPAALRVVADVRPRSRCGPRDFAYTPRLTACFRASPRVGLGPHSIAGGDHSSARSGGCCSS